MMMESVTYQVIDEPRPGVLSRFAVNPIWPLLSFMFCGYWFALIWSLFNGHALGSATRKKELVVVCASLAALTGLYFGIYALLQYEIIGKATVPYLLLLFSAIKIASMYWLLLLQYRTTELFQHFGGKLVTGLPIIIVGYFIGTQINPLIRSTVSGLVLV